MLVTMNLHLFLSYFFNGVNYLHIALIKFIPYDMIRLKKKTKKANSRVNA